MVQFGADTAEESEAHGRAVPRLARSRRRATQPERIDDLALPAGGRPQRRPVAGTRGGPRSHRLPARRPGPLARMGGLRGPPGADRRPTSATSWHCMTSTGTTARSTATSGRAASTPGSTSTCAQRRASRKYRAFLEEAADLCVSYGGSLSGEHGDGQQRAELLSKQYGDELLQAMREFKLIWDPDWKMNPGKVIDPYRLDEHLKLGTDYNPWRPPVRFAYTQGQGRLRPRRAALRRDRQMPRPRRRYASCAPATWSPARRRTPPADARDCCSRCSKAT